MLQAAAGIRRPSYARPLIPSFTYPMNPLVRQMVLAGASGAATLAILVAAPTHAQDSALEWADGASGFTLCDIDGCDFSILFNNRIPDVTVSQASGIFDAPMNTGANVLTNAPITGSFTYSLAIDRYILQDDHTFLFDGADANGLPSVGASFFAGSTFTGVGGGNQNLAWDFDPSKLGVGITGTDIGDQILTAASLTINASSASVASYSGTIETTTRTDTVPGPLGVAGVGAMFATARRLRRRIQAV